MGLTMTTSTSNARIITGYIIIVLSLAILLWDAAAYLGGICPSVFPPGLGVISAAMGAYLVKRGRHGTNPSATDDEGHHGA